jgi:hypothetical protein
MRPIRNQKQQTTQFIQTTTVSQLRKACWLVAKLPPGVNHTQSRSGKI